MLPPPCRWIDAEDASYLYWNYGCCAKVTADGWVSLDEYGIPGEHKAANREQGKRFVERFVEKRTIPAIHKRIAERRRR